MKKAKVILAIGLLIFAFFPAMAQAEAGEAEKMKIELSRLCHDNAIMVLKIKDLLANQPGNDFYFIYDKNGKYISQLPSIYFYLIIRDLIKRNEDNNLLALKIELERDYLFLSDVFQKTKKELRARR